MKKQIIGRVSNALIDTLGRQLRDMEPGVVVFIQRPDGGTKPDMMITLDQSMLTAITQPEAGGVVLYCVECSSMHEMPGDSKVVPMSMVSLLHNKAAGSIN